MQKRVFLVFGFFLVFLFFVGLGFCSGRGSVRDIALQDGGDDGGGRRERHAAGDRLHGLCDVDQLCVRLHHRLAAVHNVWGETIDGDADLYILAATGDVKAEA